MPSETTPARDYLHDRVIALRDTPMQRKLRRIRPWPVGCVFIEHPGMTMDDIRGHFRLMRRLGFTALKQCQTCRGTDNAAVMHAALEEGIIPWWYGEAGWEDPTPELLESLGLDPRMPIEALRENRTWLDRQAGIMHERVDREAAGRSGRKAAKQACDAPDRKRGKDWVPSVQPDFKFELEADQAPLFLDWLKRQYGSIDALNEAWNLHHCMLPGPRSQSGEFEDSKFWQSWDHLAGELVDVINGGFREYRRSRDVLRFKADNYINWLRDRLDAQLASDPNAPARAGGEMGLFLPFASRGTDMEGIAGLMDDRGSFYPSFHPAWHFEEVNFEGLRPMYMQASITVDWFKGGWNATWESTGGPQQMTGHKAPFVPEVRDQKPGFTVDGATMTQLMLSWIAAGYRGFGLWSWSMRTAGWEGGEFALLTRNNEPSDRAIAAGRIGTACRSLRDELWQARREPDVGVFQDWDMEAIWAAASIGGRDFFKKEPIRARIGAARALINRNIPWEHVTGRNLRDGLADRYRAIYLPACLALDHALMDLLAGYVRRGGRVELDAPGGWYEYFGRVLTTTEGGAFEKLFGVKLNDFQFSSPQQRPWHAAGRRVDGSILDLAPTSAEVVETFDDANGNKPAITRNAIGDGAAIVIAYEASRLCTAPGDAQTERVIVEQSLGDGYRPPFGCDDAIVYRLAAPDADHYFLLSDQPARTVALATPGYAYAGFENVLNDRRPIDPGAIDLPAHSGVWLRAVKEKRP